MQIPYQANLLALALVVGAATLLVANLHRKAAPTLTKDALVTLSSRDPSSPDPAHVIDGDTFQLGFQTQSQQGPWVQLDLGSEKLVHHVVVYNRLDCCRERAVPLVIKLSHDGSSFTQVARVEDPFDRWDAKIPPQNARFVRAELLKFDILHFNEIEVR